MHYYRSPNEKDVELALTVLEIQDDKDKNNIRNFYKREREQNRTANIRLIKSFAVFTLKCIVVALLVWAFLQTWTERIPPQ